MSRARRAAFLPSSSNSKHRPKSVWRRAGLRDAMNQTIFFVIAVRVAYGALTVLVVTSLIFFAVELMPGDAAQAILGQMSSEESLQALRTELGLDRPLLVRYFEWLSGLMQGDLGRSFENRAPVADIVAPRLANTIFLSSYAALITFPIAISLGVFCAVARGTAFDSWINTISLAMVSLPEFFVAYILIFLLAIKAGLFPSMSTDVASMNLVSALYYCTLPAVALSLVLIAHTMRMTRASLIDLLKNPYMEMADLKGVRPARIIVWHALPNALAPIINVVLLNMAYLIVGVVVIEVVFVYPGLGQLFVNSVAKRDIPVMQACCLIFAVTYIVLNLLADVATIVSNPRLRTGR